MKRLIQALAFAAEEHRDQRRRDTSQAPYINHPIAVAETLATLGDVTDESVLCAALLHDVVEDTDTSREDIQEHFGKTIADLVAQLTDPTGFTREVRKQQQIDKAPNMLDGARLIKLADQLCNVADLLKGKPKDWNHARTINYIDWAEKVVAAHAEVSPKLASQFKTLVEQVRQKYAEQTTL